MRKLIDQCDEDDTSAQLLLLTELFSLKLYLSGDRIGDNYKRTLVLEFR